VSETRAALDRAHRHAAEFLDGLDDRPVGPTVSRAEIRARLGGELGGAGVAAVTVIDDLVEATRGGVMGSASGRFFAWVNGGALPAALAADWLVSAWDNNAGIHACGPAATVVEEVAGLWVKTLLRLPAEASFAFTTGCQMAHVTCLAAARHALLHRLGWDVEAEGLTGAPPIRVLATDQFHGSIERAVRFLGLGSRSLRPLTTDGDARLAPETLRAALAQSEAPTIVVLDAGDLNVGAVDPFCELIPIAKAAGAWVHVDGAFGLWARASPRYAPLVEGVERADSWATDAHKWLNTPNDCGVAVVRDAGAHKGAMSIRAAYLTAGGEARDPIDWTPDWTRRARAIPVYAAIRELGADGVAALVDRGCAMASALTLGLADMPGVELVAAPSLNQGLVRFLDPRPGAGEADHDAWTDRTLAAINAEGTAFFSATTWRGRRALRISVVNWRTCDEDVARTIAAVRTVLERGV